jgi:hypothetical protein
MRTILTSTIGVIGVLGLLLAPYGANAVDRHGPMRTGLFEVTIDDSEIKSWKTITIPSISVELSVEQGSYREGNEATYEVKLWGQPTYDVEMERGVKSGDIIVEYENAGKADAGRKEIAVKLQPDSDGDDDKRDDKGAIVRYSGSNWTDGDDSDKKITKLISAFPEKIKKKLHRAYETLQDDTRAREGEKKKITKKEANAIMAASLITLDVVTKTDYLDDPLTRVSERNHGNSDQNKSGGQNPQAGKEIKIPAKKW